MDRLVRVQKSANPLNYANIGGKNPRPPVAAPKEPVSKRWRHEKIDKFGARSQLLLFFVRGEKRKTFLYVFLLGEKRVFTTPLTRNTLSTNITTKITHPFH
jgi:hypothetical protein